MIDGGFLRKKYHAAFKENISALQIKNFVGNIIKYSGFGGINTYRVYFYDCKPCDAKTTYPVSNKALNLAKTTQYDESLKLINDTSCYRRQRFYSGNKNSTAQRYFCASFYFGTSRERWFKVKRRCLYRKFYFRSFREKQRFLESLLLLADFENLLKNQEVGWTFGEPA